MVEPNKRYCGRIKRDGRPCGSVVTHDGHCDGCTRRQNLIDSLLGIPQKDGLLETVLGRLRSTELQRLNDEYQQKGET